MMKPAKVIAVILAAGTGERMRNFLPKQFVTVAGKTLLEHTLEVFEKSDCIDEIILVIHPKFRPLAWEIIVKNNYCKIIKMINGGDTRRESTRIAVNAIEDDNAFVLIHDAVRPFVTDRIIQDCITALKHYDAVDVAVPSTDTIIKVNQANVIQEVPPRKWMMKGQTPQAFKVGILKKAHRLAAQEPQINVTDDCSLILKYKLGKVYVVRGEERNIKVTYVEDIFLADKIFQLKSMSLSKQSPLTKLKRQVIVVFGGTSGIGAAIAKMAGKSGARVYSFSRRLGVDVSMRAQVMRRLKQVTSREGRIDHVIVTAAQLCMGKLETRQIPDIVREVNVNYFGAIHVIQASARYLRASKGSITLFTSSSYTRGRALFSIYSSMKAALVNLVQGVAEEMAHEGVRINAINPERTATALRSKNFGQEAQRTLLTPEAVAKVTLQVLLSDFTGQVIDVRRSASD